MLTPSIALLISIAAVLLLLRLKLHPGFAIFIGSLIISLLVLPLRFTPDLMLQALLSYQTLRFLVVIASALTLSRLMEGMGLLSDLAVTMEKITPRLAVHLIPALIGFVPMPGGALVSATTSRDLFNRLGLTSEQGTFINYWFRHLWEFSIPVYPSIIITSVLLGVPFSFVMATLLPMTVITILAGAPVSYGMLRKIPKTKRRPTRNIAYKLLRASWPVLLLILMILLGLDAMIAFPLTLVLLALQRRAKWPELGKALRYGLNPKILIFLYSIMLYKATIESSNAADVFFSDMQALGVPISAALAVLPFLMGFMTGSSTAFVGIAFPILIPSIVSGSMVNSGALLLAYVSGMIGMLLSPLHLCLVLSADYFGARLARVYKYILPLYLIIEAIAVLIYYIGQS